MSFAQFLMCSLLVQTLFAQYNIRGAGCVVWAEGRCLHGRWRHCGGRGWLWWWRWAWWCLWWSLHRESIVFVVQYFETAAWTIIDKVPGNSTVSFIFVLKLRLCSFFFHISKIENLYILTQWMTINEWRYLVTASVSSSESDDKYIHEQFSSAFWQD